MRRKGRAWRQRRTKTENSQSLSHKTEYIALFRWAKQNGVMLNKMKPYNFANSGRGLMAANPIDAGDLLVSVPKKLLITEQMLRTSYIGRLKSTAVQSFTLMELLCLFLINEQSLGDQSFWFPYISMLPTHFNTPAYFNPQELEQTPEFFANQGQAQKENIRKCFASLKEFNSCYGTIKNLTLKDVQWAWNVVNTRSVYMDCDWRAMHSEQTSCHSCALAPLLDLLNHSCNVQIEAGFSEATQCYQLYTMTRFKKGDQVFINYGPHSNRKLLVEYGFVLSNNIHNSIKISSKLVYDIVSQHHEISRNKYGFISKYNLEDTYFCSPNGFSWSLDTALKILSLEDKNVKQLRIDHLLIGNGKLVKLFARKILEFMLDGYCKSIARVSLWNDGHGLTEKMGQLMGLLEYEMNTVQRVIASLE